MDTTRCNALHRTTPDDTIEQGERSIDSRCYAPRSALQPLLAVSFAHAAIVELVLSVSLTLPSLPAIVISLWFVDFSTIFVLHVHIYVSARSVTLLYLFIFANAENMEKQAGKSETNFLSGVAAGI